MRFIRSCPIAYPVTSSNDPAIRSGGGLSRPTVPANLYAYGPVDQSLGLRSSVIRCEVGRPQGPQALRGSSISCPLHRPVQSLRDRISNYAVPHHHPLLLTKDNQKPGGGRPA